MDDCRMLEHGEIHSCFCLHNKFNIVLLLIELLANCIEVIFWQEELYSSMRKENFKGSN